MSKRKKTTALIDSDSDDSESGSNLDEVGWACCFTYVYKCGLFNYFSVVWMEEKLEN